MLRDMTLSRGNAGNNVDILLNVHDVFHESAARDNAGNNVDILLNVHDVFHESVARDNAGNLCEKIIDVTLADCDHSEKTMWFSSKTQCILLSRLLGP
jgi:hypothetical protein